MVHKDYWLSGHQNNVEHRVATIQGNTTINKRTFLCVCGGSRDSSVGGGES